MFGFPKSAKDSIRADELKGFKDLAEEMLNYDAEALEKAMANNAVTEVVCDDKDIQQ